MKLLFLFNLGIFCDNIEIASKDFDKLLLNDITIESKHLRDNASVKISHIGTSIYYLSEVEPRKFVLKDKTIYYDKNKKPAEIRIDIEYKTFGVATFVWKFIFYVTIFTAISTVIASRAMHTLLRLNEIVIEKPL